MKNNLTEDQRDNSQADIDARKYEDLQRLISQIHADEWAKRQQEIMDNVIDRFSALLQPSLEAPKRDEEAYNEHWRRVFAAEMLNSVIARSSPSYSDESMVQCHVEIAVDYAEALLDRLNRNK